MQQALRLNFYIVNWMGEAQLTATANGTDPSGPTLAQLGAGFSSVPAAVTAPSPGFPRTIVGQSSAVTVTITATTAVTVASLAASGPFSLGTPSAPLPAYLPINGTINVPVTFQPVVVGSSVGVLTVTTFGNRHGPGQPHRHRRDQWPKPGQYHRRPHPGQRSPGCHLQRIGRIPQ